jgi:hypothetical protein
MGWFTDLFNRADNADLGANWTPFTGRALKIASNTATPTAVLTTANEFYTGTAPTNNQFSRISIATFTAPAEIGVLVRSGTDPATWTNYQGYASNRGGGTTTAIDKIVAGTPTGLASENATTWVAGDILKLTVLGQNLFIYRNGVLLLSAFDAALSSGTLGLYAYSETATTDSALDNFVGGDLPQQGQVYFWY